jgi:hypothetical protein
MTHYGKPPAFHLFPQPSHLSLANPDCFPLSLPPFQPYWICLSALKSTLSRSPSLVTA